jgi:4-aminobutyrate aminotransferase-like enzyme
LKDSKKSNTPVAAVIIEPIHSITSSYLQQLYSLSKDHGSALIIDERNTGCGASGKGFWGSSTPSDYVVFGKRT